MKNIITIEGNELRLCSGLGEYAFGKTNYNTIVSQQGILATCDSKSGEPLHFSFEPWTFSEIKSFETEDNNEPLVFYCAKNPLSKKVSTLLEIFYKAGTEQSTTNDKDLMYYSAFAVCSALTQAAKEKPDFPIVGAGGILIDLQNSGSGKFNILFLPQNLFKYSIASFSTVEQADLHNCWVNPSLLEMPAICFERASIAYKMLTGRFAYSSSNNIDRNSDILDQNFLPLELSVNGINTELANAINKGLKLNSNSVNIPGKKNKGKKSEELIPETEFPLELLKNAKDSLSSDMNDKEFEEKVKSYKKLQSSKINTKRTIRKNTTTILLSIIAVFVVILCIRGAYKNHQSDYTTIGFTSTQTIQAFFHGMNTTDIPLIQDFIEGKSANQYLDIISNIFVISKQNQSSNSGLGYVNPAKYFVIVTDPTKSNQAGIYGATNIRIDGKPVKDDIVFSQYKDKPVPLTSENGVTILKNDTSIHIVEYYTIHTEDENHSIYVTKNKDIFTLTFKKNKWVITDIEKTSEDVELNSNIFKGEYYNLIIQNDGDAAKSVQQLSLTYDFLPTYEEVKAEQTLWNEYLSNPYKDILGDF